MFSCEICAIFKNTFIYRAPPVAATEYIVTNQSLLHYIKFSVQKQPFVDVLQNMCFKNFAKFKFDKFQDSGVQFY